MTMWASGTGAPDRRSKATDNPGDSGAVAGSFDSGKWKRSDSLFAIFLISSLELIGRWFVYHGNESPYLKSEATSKTRPD
jgi:hypothetical protein